MARLTELTLIDLLSAFRSPEPTPGGGSASALAGAVGASLVAMVGGLSGTRATTAEDIERLAGATRQCTRIGDRLAVLVELDSEAYARVVSAYRLPRATDGETIARTREIQQALRAAIDAPLEVMRCCTDAIEQAVVVAELGSRKAASDVEIGLNLLVTGLEGAGLNVEINLGSVKDASYVAGVGEASARFDTEARTHVAAARGFLRRPAT